HFAMEPGHICIGRTKIGENTLVGLESVIGPVKVGKNVRINARSVVMRNIPDNAIAAGNPARIIGYKK
ncbi:MAG: DapH/DapD/GlmU-related protein, partial [Nanoarchaeota archaeon]